MEPRNVIFYFIFLVRKKSFQGIIVADVSHTLANLTKNGKIMYMR